MSISDFEKNREIEKFFKDSEEPSSKKRTITLHNKINKLGSYLESKIQDDKAKEIVFKLIQVAFTSKAYLEIEEHKDSPTRDVLVEALTNLRDVQLNYEEVEIEFY